MKNKVFPSKTTFSFLNVFGLVACVIGCLSDYLINKGLIPALVVATSFPNAVFAAICTIVSLGIAVSSIVIAAMNRKVLGYSIADILVKTKALDFKRSITVLFLTVIAGVAGLIFDYCTLLCLILIYNCVYMIILNIAVWQLAANEKYVEKLIAEELEAGSPSIETVERWISELESAIINKDDPMQNKYITLLHDYLDKYPKDAPTEFLTGCMKRIFRLSVPEIGFSRAYEYVLCLNDPTNEKLNSLYDKEDVAIECIDEIQFMSADKIADLNLSHIIHDITGSTIQDPITKTRFAYRIFRAIHSNQVLSEKVRFDMMKTLINQTTESFPRKDPDKIYLDVYIGVFKTFVLENEDLKEREILFSHILHRLFSMAQPASSRKKYIDYLAQTFRLLYFYAAYEKELLTEEYRNQLSKLFDYQLSGKDNFKMSLVKLVQKYEEELCDWYVNEIINNGGETRFGYEYYPKDVDLYFKDTVWTEHTLILFSFLFYLSTTNYQLYSLGKTLSNSNLEPATKRSYIDIAVSFFDNSHELISIEENTHKALTVFNQTTKLSRQIPERLLVENYKELQGLQVELHKQLGVQNETAEINAKEVIVAVESFFAQNGGISINRKMSLTNAQRFRLRPTLIRRDLISTESIAHTTAMFFQDYINHRIEKELPIEKVDFSLEGIKRLLSLIKQKKYAFRNCHYCDDLAFGAEVRQSPEFKELREKMESIPDSKKSFFSDTLFLTKNVSINFRFIKMNVGEKPTREQCNSCLEKTKISEGKYRVDNILVDYDQAIALLEDTYCTEEYEFEIITNISPKIGFVVRYY